MTKQLSLPTQINDVNAFNKHTAKIEKELKEFANHIEKRDKLENGLVDALNLPSNDIVTSGGALNNTQTLYNNISQRLITLEPMTLNYAYKNYGFLQTAIDQPVEDAFRGGVQLESATFSVDEIEQLHQSMEDNGDWEEIKSALKWASLFGGGCLICNTTQSPDKVLSEKKLKDMPLKFYASDRWETTALDTTVDPNKSNYLYHDTKLDNSRVKIVLGKTAPYYIRIRLQGWGLSYLEATLPPLVQYLKSQNVILELLDEAKIDVLKIKDLAMVLAQTDGTSKIRKRVETAAQNKNYKSTLTMDAEDDYQQKQVNFGGLPEMMKEIRINICAYLKIPMSKLFGLGSSGFSSGEDDLENYNTLVESIRFQAKGLIKWVADLRCMQLFGRKAPDLSIKWKNLRVLTENEESEIMSRKVDNVMKMLNAQLITKRQAAEKLVKEEILDFDEEQLESISDEYAENEMQEDITFE